MACRAVYAGDPMWDHACFHAQQAAEKALRAAMVACELAVPRTHDLKALVASLLDALPQLEPRRPELAEHAIALTPHGVAPRYPSFLAPETDDERGEAIRRAAEILDVVRVLLGDRAPFR